MHTRELNALRALTLSFVMAASLAGCTSLQSRDYFPNDGKDDSVGMQAEIDALAATGGGTVRLDRGTYNLKRPVYLRDNIVLEGTGPETILTNEGLNDKSTWGGVTVFAGTLAPASFTYNDGTGHRGYRVQRVDNTTVRLVDCTAPAAQPAVGQVAWLASTQGEEGRGSWLRPTAGEMHLVIGLSDCTVSFADPVTIPDDLEMNLHWVEVDRTRYNDVERNIPIKQAAVRNLQLRSEASMAMLTTGCYACEFTDLTIGRSRRLLAVQGMRNGVYRDISGIFGERAIEFAMFATDNVVENITAQYEPRDGYGLRPVVRLGESARANMIRNVELDMRAADTLANPIRFDESSDNTLEAITLTVDDTARPASFIYRTAGARRGRFGQLPQGTQLRDVKQCVGTSDRGQNPPDCEEF